MNQNNKKISQNKNEISKAKSENSTLKQVRAFEADIKKLQREHDITEKKYKDLFSENRVNEKTLMQISRKLIKYRNYKY